MNESGISSANIQPPDLFDFQKPESWTTWVTRFERYMSVAKLTNSSSKEKVDLLCYTMGVEAEDILARIVPAAADRSIYETVKTKFDEFFAPKKNVVFDRYKFNARVQQPGESVDTFITALYSLADKCDYSTLKESLIRDRIVIGIADKKVSQRLQLNSELTLDQAVTIARQAETQYNEAKNLRLNEGQGQASSINKVYMGKKNYDTKDDWNNKTTSSKKFSNVNNNICLRCGSARHQQGKHCPAVNSKCRKCDRIGHWDRVCRTKNVRIVETEACNVSEENLEVCDAYFLGSIYDEMLKSNKYYAKMYVSEIDKVVEFYLDTGAEVTCVPYDKISDSLLSKVQKADKPIFGPDFSELNLFGILDLHL